MEDHAVALGGAHPAGAVPGTGRSRRRARGRRRPARAVAVARDHERPVSPPAPQQKTFSPWSVASSMLAAARLPPGSGSAPQTPEPVVLGVDPVERQPLDRVQVALEDPPDRAVGLGDRAHEAHSSARVGGGVSAPACSSAANAAWGKAGCRHRAPRRCAAISSSTSRTATAVTRGALPRDGSSGFPSGIGTGQSGASGPGSSPLLRARSTSGGDESAVASAVARRAPDADAVVREHDPAARELECASSIVLRVVPAPVVRVRRPPDDPSPPRRGELQREVREMPPRNPPSRLASRRARRQRRERPVQVALDRLARRCSGAAGARYPCTSTPCPSSSVRASRSGCCLHTLAEHEERRLHTRLPRARRAPPGVPRGSGPSSKVSASTLPNLPAAPLDCASAWWA